jgi:hypothetical protein
VKGREFAKLARRHLMPRLPGFALKDGRIYALPVDRLLRGFTLYSSGFSRERFTIYCTVGLLYVPDSVDTVLDGLGDRLPVLAGRGDQWWQWDPADEEGEEAMMADIRALVVDVGVPFLDELGSVGAVAERLRRSGEYRSDPHVAEALAYSLVLSGDDEGAREVLRVLKRITLEDEERTEWWADLHRGTPEAVEDDWVLEVGKRGVRVEEALALSTAGATELLDAWNEEQLGDLRLPKTA